MTINPETSDVTRRRVLQGTALGVAAIPAVGLLGACATSGSDESGEDVENSGDAENPFDVDPSAPLSVVIFDGGYGDAYATEGHQPMYKAKFPKAEIEHMKTQKIADKLQPKFAEGSPPDVIDNSGDNRLALEKLVKDGELAELTPLLEAPSIDDPKVKVKDTLRPGVIEAGTFNGKVYALNYAYNAWGIWYDSALFKEKSWTVPTSWDEMMALCADIKKDGMAPWTYAGVHPQYLLDMAVTLAARLGGRQVSVDISNLKENSWTNDHVVAAAEAMYSLYEKGYILEGTPGIDHIDSQTAWNKHEAAFIPCGAWIANEQKDKTPEGFEYGFLGVPALEGSTQPNLLWATGGEPFIVPEKAANKAGGYEYLRLMLTQEGAQAFADATSSPASMKGVTVDNPAANSVGSAIPEDFNDLHAPRIFELYNQLKEELRPHLGSLMKGSLKPDKFCDAMQKGVDKYREDGNEIFEEK